VSTEQQHITLRIRNTQRAPLRNHNSTSLVLDCNLSS